MRQAAGSEPPALAGLAGPQLVSGAVFRARTTRLDRHELGDPVPSIRHWLPAASWRTGVIQCARDADPWPGH